jgi:recombination protein RecT
MAKAQGNNQDLQNKLQTRATGAPAAKSPADTVAAYLKKMEGEIAKALPKHMTPERLARVALTTIRTNPKLLECNIHSLMAAVMQSAQLGLEPGLIGHCYIIPYGKEATFIIGYKGMIDLARRSGNIESIYAHGVYEKDEFNIEYGLNQKLEHKPYFGDDRGKFKGAYMVAKFRDGGYYFEYMPQSDIEKRKSRSKASNNGPWVTDYEEMAKKTVIRHAFKYLPISVEIMKAAEQDESIKHDIGEDMTDIPEADFVDAEYKIEDEGSHNEPSNQSSNQGKDKKEKEDVPEGEGNQMDLTGTPFENK